MARSGVYRFHSIEASGIQIRDAGLGVPVRIFNNTMYGIGDDIDGIRASIWIQETSNSENFSLEINNNIIYNTCGGGYFEINENVFFNVSGSSNLWFSIGGS